MQKNYFEKNRKVYEKTPVPEFLFNKIAGLDVQLTKKRLQTTEHLRLKLHRYNLVILISITPLPKCERKSGFSNSTSFFITFFEGLVKWAGLYKSDSLFV